MLQYPINIKTRNPEMAKVIISQYGGPDGELAASLRYLSQRFAMPDQKAKAILNDIGTEELAHLEMVGTIVHQLTDGASIEEIDELCENVTFNEYSFRLLLVSDLKVLVCPPAVALIPHSTTFALSGT